MNKLKIRALGAAVVVGGFGGLIAAGALAGTAPPPPGTSVCPKGGDWDLVTLAETIPEVDNGNFHDQNDDGYVCKFSNPNNNPGDVPEWIVKDNTKKPAPEEQQ